jgi:protein-S-isoprenylcysteine O-methyltransferase Ste14
MLQYAALIELLACWILWSLAFVKPSRQAAERKETASAPTSRWGIFLVMAGFMFAWMYVRPAGFEKSTPALIASMILAPPSVVLAWLAAHRLGKQWRFKAAIREGHELVQTGAYRWLRHPIYASMLGILLATLAAWTWWPLAICSFVTFVAGTEVRVRTEERILTAHFGDAYTAFRARTWAYIPFIR